MLIIEAGKYFPLNNKFIKQQCIYDPAIIKALGDKNSTNSIQSDGIKNVPQAGLAANQTFKIKTKSSNFQNVAPYLEPRALNICPDIATIVTSALRRSAAKLISFDSAS